MFRHLVLSFALLGLACVAARADSRVGDAFSPTQTAPKVVKLGDSRAEIYRTLGYPRREKWEFSLDFGGKHWLIQDARAPFEPPQTLWIYFVHDRAWQISVQGSASTLFSLPSSANQFPHFMRFSQLAVKPSFCLTADCARLSYYPQEKQTRALAN